MDSETSALRVAEQLRRLIAGKPAGARLPSVRHLVAELRVSAGTVNKALAMLSAEGLLLARPGLGTFVASPARPASRPAADRAGSGDRMAWQAMALGPARASAESILALTAPIPETTIALSTGYLAESLQPTAALAAAAAQAARRPGVWGPLSVEGLGPLRRWFAAGLGDAFAPHEVIVCPGTQAALAAAFRGLVPAGSPVLIESPTYHGALAAARAAGLVPVPVPVDRDGVRPDLLEKAFVSTGARLFYCQPNFANPSGAVLSAERRAQVLDVARAAGAFVIEDDWAHDFCLEGEPPPVLAGEDRTGQVIYIRSLTKSTAPGLRIGALCARGAALQRLRTSRAIDDFFVSGLLQETALCLVTSPAWGRHLRQVRSVLLERRDILAAALRRLLGEAALPLVPAGGLHLWLALPHGVSDREIARRAARAGVFVSSGEAWFPTEPPGPYLRLSYGAATSDDLEKGVEILGAIIADAMTMAV